MRSSRSPNILTVDFTTTLPCCFSFALNMVPIPFLTSLVRDDFLSFGRKIMPIAFHHNQTHALSQISMPLILSSVFV